MYIFKNKRWLIDWLIIGMKKYGREEGGFAQLKASRGVGCEDKQNLYTTGIGPPPPPPPRPPPPPICGGGLVTVLMLQLPPKQKLHIFKK